MKRLIPTLNRILVQKVLRPAKTETGILLPEKSTKLNSGKVIAVGPGSRDNDGKLLPVSVKEGDTVLLPEYGGTVVQRLNSATRSIICSGTKTSSVHCTSDENANKSLTQLLVGFFVQGKNNFFSD